MARAYPYVTVPGSLRKFITQIPQVGTPAKVTTKWLESIGFKSKNDRTIIPTLKQVGVLSADGVPGDLWASLRAGDKQGREAFGGALKASYSGLFSTYPDAHRKDSEALLNFFRANTDLGDQAQRKCVATFQVLTEFGDFNGEAPSRKEPDADVPARSKRESPRNAPGDRGPGAITLNVNIQLQLPPNADGETYDQLFKAMGEHLGGMLDGQ